MIRLLATAAVVSTLGLASIPAHAQTNRTFVSGAGSDDNPCTREAPCRSFAQAITQTIAGGEIVVLDSAGYGSITINKSITITNPGGVEAGITPPSGADAVTINATTAIDVTLRGLTLSGKGIGSQGISVTTALPPGPASTLTLIGCVIKDFTSHGLFLQPTGPVGAPKLYVALADSFILRNAGDGIHTAPDFGLLRMSVYRTVIRGNANGLAATGGIIRVAHSYIDANTSTGVLSSGPTTLFLKASTVVENIGGKDISNGAALSINNENEIGVLENPSPDGAFSDGTNNILSFSGNALTLLPRR
jgi:hypothetical protein